jgi:hypothetical protein
MRSTDFTKHGTLLLTCVFITIVRSPPLAEDRPDFQSPTGMRVSLEENLPLEWVGSEFESFLWNPSPPRNSLLHLPQKPNS